MHKRCKTNVPCNCGIKQRDLAAALKEMNISPDKLRPQRFVSTVIKIMHMSACIYVHTHTHTHTHTYTYKHSHSHTHTHTHTLHETQSSRRSETGSGLFESNGVVESLSPSIPAPVRANTIPIELPISLANKMTLSDFHFLKVRRCHNRDSTRILGYSWEYVCKHTCC